MKISTIFPQADIGSDPAAIRDFAQAVKAEQVPSWMSYAAASLLIEAGEPLTYIQQQLGRHSPGFTLTVYRQLLPPGDRRAVDRLDDPVPEATISNPRATDVPRTVPAARDCHA